jgi:RimJ/RimL family protein N-acetyltransferase
VIQREEGIVSRTEDEIITERLSLRPWHVEDAEEALVVYGDPEIARWLSPAQDRVADVDSMRAILRSWQDAAPLLAVPSGRWAVRTQADGRIVGGVVLLPIPPHATDLELGWQVRRDAWGNRYATEAGAAVARRAFAAGADEIFAVVRPANARAAAAARRLGMEWVGETDKYYDLRLQVYRLRPADLA